MAKSSDAPSSRREFWQRLIAQHTQSGLSIRAFCQLHQVAEHSFYFWRKRLGSEGATVRFALVAPTGSATAPVPLELLLASGHRLRIAPGVDPATLRTVLDVLAVGA
jgi:transposase-like protein